MANEDVEMRRKCDYATKKIHASVQDCIKQKIGPEVIVAILVKSAADYFIEIEEEEEGIRIMQAVIERLGDSRITRAGNNRPN